MAARNRKGLSEATRKRIQTTMIVKRLENHIDTKPSDEDYQDKLMQPTQVTAALGLIKKTLPDLSAVEHSGEIKTDADSLTEAEIISRLAELNERRIALEQSTEDNESKEVTH